MTHSIWLQSRQLLFALALGMGYGVLYDLLRGLRRSGKWLTPLLDLLFALTVLAGNLLFALHVGGGEYRLFAFCAGCAGAALWFLSGSRLLLPVFCFFWRCVAFPARCLAAGSKKILKKSEKNVKNSFQA